MIGHLKDATMARNFGDYLYVQGIDNQIDAEKDGTYAVWIHREEDLERGRALLSNYQTNPADLRFQNQEKAAGELREQKRREEAAYEKRVKERRHLFRTMSAYGIGPVTLLLIVISVLVYIDGMIHGGRFLQNLYLTNVDLNYIGDYSLWQSFVARATHLNILLPEIRSGEVWRLITPIFLHFGILHIFFNMLWLRDLGSMIEGRQNSGIMILLVVVIAVISNFAQYLFTGGGFGGMSGVVYGLFGYIWMRGKFDPGSGLLLHPTTVTMMIIWLFVCMIGIMGPVANAAHTAGLLVGVAWGYLSSLSHR